MELKQERNPHGIFGRIDKKMGTVFTFLPMPCRKKTSYFFLVTCSYLDISLKTDSFRFMQWKSSKELGENPPKNWVKNPQVLSEMSSTDIVTTVVRIIDYFLIAAAGVACLLGACLLCTFCWVLTNCCRSCSSWCAECNSRSRPSFFRRLAPVRVHDLIV